MAQEQKNVPNPNEHNQKTTIADLRSASMLTYLDDLDMPGSYAKRLALYTVRGLHWRSRMDHTGIVLADVIQPCRYDEIDYVTFTGADALSRALGTHSSLGGELESGLFEMVSGVQENLALDRLGYPIAEIGTTLRRLAPDEVASVMAEVRRDTDALFVNIDTDNAAVLLAQQFGIYDRSALIKSGQVTDFARERLGAEAAEKFLVLARKWVAGLRSARELKKLTQALVNTGRIDPPIEVENEPAEPAQYDDHVIVRGYVAEPPPIVIGQSAYQIRSSERVPPPPLIEPADLLVRVGQFGPQFRGELVHLYEKDLRFKAVVDELISGVRVDQVDAVAINVLHYINTIPGKLKGKIPLAIKLATERVARHGAF